MADPQETAPVAGQREACGIESRMTTSRRMVMGMEGARSGQMSRGTEPSEAQLHDASDSVMDTCGLISAAAVRKAPSSPDDCRSPAWNSGCLCCNVCCRPRRSKNTRHAQCYQHGSMMEPFFLPV